MPRRPTQRSQGRIVILVSDHWRLQKRCLQFSDDTSRQKSDSPLNIQILATIVHFFKPKIDGRLIRLEPLSVETGEFLVRQYVSDVSSRWIPPTGSRIAR